MVLLLLFLGALDVSTFVGDLQIAQTSVRQGVRLASILGDGTCNTLSIPDIDKTIVQNVISVASTMNYATLQEIDIYKPGLPAGQPGVYRPGLDTADKFNGSGMNMGGYPLTAAQRSTAFPNEAEIGVNLKWQFRPPTGIGFQNTLTLNQYAVFRILLVPPGC